jgi:hypothetical protein
MARKNHGTDLSSACCLTFVFLLAGYAGSLHARAGDIASRCTQAAATYIGSLDAAARDRGVRPFDSKDRHVWTFRPGAALRKDGLYLGGLSDEQRVFAHRLINCALSSQGYLKATAIMQLDDLVAERIDEIVFKATEPVEIGSDFYWVSVYGEPDIGPGSAEPWGWQIEGHHLGLNFVIVGESVSVTPAFYGADPAEVHRGALAGSRLLIDERDRAFDLISSFDDVQRERAIIGDTVPRGIFTSPGRADSLDTMEGLPAADMTGDQRQLLWLLIDAYVRNLAPEIADALIADVLSDGVQRLYFSWMGPTTPGQPIYYRVHGPSLLIEFDHSVNIRSPRLEPDPNHVHSIMRVPGGDFGEDLLQIHYRESAHHQMPDQSMSVE